MKKTIIASYPRSGHHFLVNGLLMPISNENINYCEVYGHCRSVPCTDPETKLQKTHDFSLQDPISEDYKYIVQYRYPYESLVSYFNLESKCGNIEDTRKSWESFLRVKSDYWNDFMSKWAYPMTGSQVDTINVQYFDLIHNTESTIRNILNFIKIENINEDVIKNLDSRPRSQAKEFKYYSENDISYIQDKCQKHIEHLNIQETTM